MYRVTNIPLSMITSVRTSKKMIHLDKRDDGNWRLIFSEKTIGDISKGSHVKIIVETELGTTIWDNKNDRTL